MLTAIVGVNWGDEGKGRMVDLLSERCDIVVRYQGGNNAGHTVVNDKGKFILNLMPSGILRDGTVNVLGPGMVIDLEHLCGEAERLRQGGISVTPETLRISDKATVCMPYHKLLDCLEEDRLAGKKFGSTRRGIAPVYADKYMKKTLRMGDLLDLEAQAEHVADIVEWKNLTVEKGYGHEPVRAGEIMDWLRTFGLPWRDFICDTSLFLDEAADQGRDILFEAQLGALRDIDFGIFPYTSSSSTIAAYAPVGAGVPGRKLDRSIGIMKAYSSCVGEGPFTCEFFGDEAHALREAGGEYGAATGRVRKVSQPMAFTWGSIPPQAPPPTATRRTIGTGQREAPPPGRCRRDGRLRRSRLSPRGLSPSGQPFGQAGCLRPPPPRPGSYGRRWRRCLSPPR